MDDAFVSSCNYFGTILALFRDKIAAISDQSVFWPENALKCVSGRGSGAGELTALPSAANLFTVDSRRVVPAR